ncbi:GNAT family N-acetyltransferase [Halosolutus amylolyticus]|uniref:GNAT family N-acetyltransferase n=1 Tax=Halosolutus amylolyticus TaxID=2932267 RepID=A0ABD5PMI8_9EURY|nr:GNAT family N-acetyltransferase [Halosolutus amylolyticus]
METEEITLDEWERALPASGTEVFHVPAALSVVENHTDGDLRLFAGYKGQQPVALLPVFVSERSLGARTVGKTVFSPPLGLGIPRLGPVIDPMSPKRRKRERINGEFATSVLDSLDVDRRTTLFRMVTPLDDSDPRPYRWNGLNVTPEFTYVVDVSTGDLEDVMGSFSKSLRNEMRRWEELDLSIECEGIDAALRVYEDVVDQYAEFDESAPMTRSFLREFLTELPDDRWRVYVARTPDGEYASGIITLFSDDIAYYWQGGVAASYESVSVNNLLHRAILEDLLSDPALDTITGYDLVGANTERLCDYKGKFNGELRQYYVVESAGLEMQLAKSAYRTVSGSLTKG